MPFDLQYARYAPLRAVLAVGLVLTGWLAQSCRPRDGSRPSPMHTTADALTPADAATPPAPHTPPVLMAFTDPAACAAFEQDGYPCRGIEQEGTPVGVEVSCDGRGREGLPLAMPGGSAREDWRGFDRLEIELENRSTERLKVGLILRNEPGAWADGQSAGVTLASSPRAGSRGESRCGIYSTP
jgi:hypothetical protein